MNVYEVCVLQDDGSLSITAIETQLSDRSAIRMGQELAQGRKFEVWRGNECIFGRGARPVLVTEDYNPGGAQNNVA